MTFEIECPTCNKTINIEGEDLADRACDDADIECENCDTVITVGWYAEVEVRRFLPSKGGSTDA